jgi:hypothetical protein
MGSVLVKYLVGNLAWVRPLGGIFGTGGSDIGRGATEERLCRDRILALMKMKSFGKKAWLRIVGKVYDLSRVLI